LSKVWLVGPLRTKLSALKFPRQPFPASAMMRVLSFIGMVGCSCGTRMLRQPSHDSYDIAHLTQQVSKSKVFQDKIAEGCHGDATCKAKAADKLFCTILSRTRPEMAARACGTTPVATASAPVVKHAVVVAKTPVVTKIPVLTKASPPATAIPVAKAAKVASTAKAVPAAKVAKVKRAAPQAKTTMPVAKVAKAAPKPAVATVPAGKKTPKMQNKVPQGKTKALLAEASAVGSSTSARDIIANLVANAPVLQPPVAKPSLPTVKGKIMASSDFHKATQSLAKVMHCEMTKKAAACSSYVSEVAFCLAFADKMNKFSGMAGAKEEIASCKQIDTKVPQLAMLLQRQHQPMFVQKASSLRHRNMGAPEDDLAREMTHDLEMNFNKIAPFGKEDTAKELQDHAAKTQDTLVDAVENAEVAEIKRAVFRALTRLRAATIKEFDTIARLETQAIDAYNDAHHYRAENPLAHLHEDEAPVETDKLKSFH